MLTEKKKKNVEIIREEWCLTVVVVDVFEVLKRKMRTREDIKVLLLFYEIFMSGLIN